MVAEANLIKLLDERSVELCQGVSSKKRLLEHLAGLLAQRASEDEGDTFDVREVFDSLVYRERLGSTGMGHGVALPHGRLPRLSRAFGALVRLDVGIDFDASDGKLVDLVFALIVPEHYTVEHLQIIAGLAECFNRPALREAMRASASAMTLREALIACGD